MDIWIDNRQTRKQVDLDTLHEIAGRILTYMQAPLHSELSIALVDDEEIRQLNGEYRGIDRSTNVLSFAQQETFESQTVPLNAETTSLPMLLGDVILSVETTTRQAHEHGTSFEHEFCFLLTHGILHLLGYDHQTDEDADVMEELEQKILHAVLRDAYTL